MKDIFNVLSSKDKQEYDRLIERVNINIVNEYGQNLLHEAVAFHRNIIGFDVIKRGIDVNHKDKNGQTPLHYAAANYNPTLAEVIVQNGGDINIQDKHGNNALWVAVIYYRHDKQEILRLYCKYGGDSTTRNNYGKSPLDIVEEINDPQQMQIMKEYL